MFAVFMQDVDDSGEDDPAVGIYLVKEINQASVEEAIRRFRAVGETDWRTDQPVPRSESAL